MAHSAARQFARLTLYATLACCAGACGADSDHGPPIGGPPSGPIIEQEGGRGSGTDTAGQPGTNPTAGAGTTETSGGALNADGNGGATAFVIAGSDGAGRDPFGFAGSGTGRDSFGIAGTPNASAGLGPF